uniref:Gypsy retrotransposon integrase-like protein 1 n=1 Tax=Gasterosteus aculeatus aculeatus TaxID=481459 RepID=A0AAQ4RI62_GASAC
MKGRGQLILTVGGRKMRHTVWVAEVQDACILGLDFLREQGCQIDLGKATLSFIDGQVVHMRPLDSQHATTHTAGPHRCCVGEGKQTKAAMSYLSEPRLGPEPATRSLDSPVRLIPSAVEGCESLQESEAKRMTALREVWQRSAGDLDSEQQERLWQLLIEFRDCFSCDEEELGQTSLVQHTIDTGDATPIRQRPRRLPLGRQDAAERALEKMQRAGIIEPSESPWASPVVMVPKKGGEWRFCVDYRRLNDVTKKDSYPLPRVDECLDLVAGSSWFSSLDLRSGYWQVPLAEEARPKTAFCTGKGLWQFKVLCFGLCNAPATFERLMERVLAGVPHTECLVYLDDILAHGSSFDSAMAALRRVMERIKGAGLKLHPDKCRLLCRELTFLGHRIGSEGIGTVEEKVRVIREWPSPTDQRGLKSFLGLASYYRKFVRGFSGIAAPLYRLLQKDQPFVWAEDCESAFNTLQEALASAPILAAPDPEVPFVLDTDASGDGVGAVLSQAGPEGERVVAYYSKALNKAERRYCVTRRELLAVVFAARHFKYYLCGRPFTVRTDHASLQWLMTFREPEGQLARWLEELQGYEFSVVHRAGERHGNADALSRRPCSEDDCRYCDRREVREQQLVLGPNKRDREECEETVRACRELLVVDNAIWAAEQQRDPDVQPVMLWVEARQRPPWEEVAALSPWTKGLWAKFNSLQLADGVLQRAWVEPASGEKKWQTMVPRGMQGAVLEAMHGSAGSGHFGVTKTLRRVRQAFYWGRLKDFVLGDED